MIQFMELGKLNSQMAVSRWGNLIMKKGMGLGNKFGVIKENIKDNGKMVIYMDKES